MSEVPEKNTCGVVMPISPMDGCDAIHWSEVKSILYEAIEAAGLKGNLVSDADDAGLIHKRIIQNLYENPIVVCDVSGKNPNVMFELGMRLAFDKPTIIVKDDKTSYSFDTGSIEHLEYPRDLRFYRIREFSKKLTEKITATLKSAENNSEYTSFLKHFGSFTVAKIEKIEVPGQEFIIEELRSLRASMDRIEQGSRSRKTQPSTPLFSVGDEENPTKMRFPIDRWSKRDLNQAYSILGNLTSPANYIVELLDNKPYLSISSPQLVGVQKIQEIITHVNNVRSSIETEALNAESATNN